MTVILLGACHNHKHDEHEGHEHSEHAEEHAHSEAEAHEGHDHSAEAKEKAEAHEEHGDEIVLSETQTKTAGVKVETAQPAAFSEVVRVSGRIMPAQGEEATVTATMAGIVNFASPTLTPGATVAAGQSLFSINAKNLSNGDPAAAAQAELEAAKKAVERARKLAADRLISANELDAAEQRYATAKTTAKSSGSAVRTAVSPISGFVKEVLVTRGAYVEAGQALATVTQCRRLYLQADVPERFYEMLPRVESANFRPSYETQRTFTLKELGGKLVSRGRVATAADFFVPITFEFNNTGGIVPGSLCEVFLTGATRNNVMTVPASAIAESQGLHYIYLEVHPHTFLRREVKVGASDGIRTEILNGLEKGDKVVVNGVTQVRLAGNSTAIPHGHEH